MANDDSEFEAFLKKFRPAPPRPLPRVLKPAWWLPVRAAAAVVLLASGIWLASRQITSSRIESTVTPKVEDRKPQTAEPTATLGNLERLANTDPVRFNAVLDAQADTLLPDVARPGGVLAVLAKE
jgi:hypothetical protein